MDLRNSLSRMRSYPADTCTLCALFCIPLKLSFTYVFLIPAMLFWLRDSYRDRSFNIPSSSVPLVFFMLTLILTAPFGLRPYQSIFDAVRLCFIALTIPLVQRCARTHGILPLLLILLAGQTLAGFESVLTATYPRVLGYDGIFLGKISESGQLALSSVLAMAIALKAFPDRSASISLRALLQPSSMISFALFLVYIAAAFHPTFGISITTSTVLMLIALGGPIAFVYRNSRNCESSLISYYCVTLLVLPITSAALVLNLKRGPWLGVLIGGGVLLWYFARPYLVLLISSAAALLLGVQPIRERLLQSYSHFHISGGRSDIWQIGLELSTRFPLGIGYENSDFLNKFSLEVPPTLTHFHCNALNILVEAGWIGAVLFFWWIARLLLVAYRERESKPASILAVGIGSALLSWQVAGIVEYNFGDSEVVLVAFVCAGLLAALEENVGSVAVEKSAAPRMQAVSN